MIPLFTNDEFSHSKSSNLLPCKCRNCEKTFYLSKHQIQRIFNPNRHNTGDYCSKNCQNQSQVVKVKMVCTNCGKTFLKHKNQVLRSKDHFCSRSCSTTYHNTHKIKGTRRSKLEMFIENNLNHLYPDLIIDYNKKNVINAELDIYVPSIKLAFELNGIFHYEPIYGIEKLTNIQNNDIRKFQACIENGIELCIIDTSYEHYFKERTSRKYLDIIVGIINQKLNNLSVPPSGNDPDPIG